MAEQTKDTSSKSETGLVPWRQFLESCPPGKEVNVANMCRVEREIPSPNSPIRQVLITPEIELHCHSCNDKRFFKYIGGDLPYLTSDVWGEAFLFYWCKNCDTDIKKFALSLKPDNGIMANGTAIKFGEIPPFGPPLPSRLLKILGQDKSLFLQGYRAEKQGMGIGAFTYYRRVVNNQKNQILDEIIKVAENTKADSEIIDTLNKAKQENQFTRAIESIKDAIPPALLMDGHNPLTLLHGPLSVGIHEGDDGECLSLATDIRVVLSELADTIANILKEKADLKESVSRLHKFNSSKKSAPPPSSA